MAHQYTKLLMDESPLQVLPGLAVLIGLDEAIFMQQLHFKLYQVLKSNGREVGKIHEGRPYYYNSIPNWHRYEFPFWSEPTLKRIIRRLIAGEYNASVAGQKVIRRGLGLVETCKHLDKSRREDEAPDQTNWYTICYERFEEILKEGVCNEDLKKSPSDQSDPMGLPSDQSDPLHRITLTPPSGHFDPMLKGIREYSEITTEIKESGANFGPHLGGEGGKKLQPAAEAWAMVRGQLEPDMRGTLLLAHIKALTPISAQPAGNRIHFKLKAPDQNCAKLVTSRLGIKISQLLEYGVYSQPVDLEIST
jgi:hypothetical protein